MVHDIAIVTTAD